MTKAPVDLQDLRRRIYAKAKAEPAWRFWGLYAHVCKIETLEQAYRLAKRNNGAPGIDGVTFEAIEAGGVDGFVAKLQEELVSRTYSPSRVRNVEIPKGNGASRTLSIPTIRDRVVQGALKLILEPIFEADFQPGSFGYRPRKRPHEAVRRVTQAIVLGKTYVVDLDLHAFFDTVRQNVVLEKVAKRVEDRDVMRLVKLVMRACGKRGVPQGGVLSPLLSNIYLNEVDRMLERAKQRTRYGQWTALEYVRFADDVVVLVDGHTRHTWLRAAVEKRLREEFARLHVELNEEKSQFVDLTEGEGFGFLGFEFRRTRSRAGRWMPLCVPQGKARTALLRRLAVVFRSFRSRPIQALVAVINPILRGWTGYFAIGNSSRCFSYVRDWVEKKVRRHLGRARLRQGFGWKRWSRRWLYEALGLFSDYRVRHPVAPPKVAPAG